MFSNSTSWWPVISILLRIHSIYFFTFRFSCLCYEFHFKGLYVGKCCHFPLQLTVFYWQKVTSSEVSAAPWCQLWSLPLDQPHSRTAVFWSICPPGGLWPCGPERSNNPWESLCSCLWPGWSAGVGWSLSSAPSHSPTQQSLWCWSVCASPGQWAGSPCWRRTCYGLWTVSGEWSWCWCWCYRGEWSKVKRNRPVVVHKSPPPAAGHWWTAEGGVHLSCPLLDVRTRPTTDTQVLIP